jgi:ABC-type sulfate transport system permease component
VSMLVWVMMGIAIWHFAVFVPDRFWGGIVGAFLAAIAGAALFGLLVSGLQVPGRQDTDIVQAFIAIPGAVLGLALCWLYGARTEEPLT